MVRRSGPAECGIEPRHNEPASDSKLDIWWDVAAAVLLVSTAIVVLAVPVFPSQDGPVHLYYAGVLRGLLTHSGPYPQYFAIKTLFTPYALEYAVLLALETLFSPPMSEKVLLCGYIFAFGAAFRYLVGAVGDRRSPWSLAAIPFCLNLLVYLGFLNYCFGVVLLLFLSGYYIRHADRLAARSVSVLLGGLILMLLTHPLCPAVFLLFLGLHLTSALVHDAIQSRAWRVSLLARRRQMLLVASMAVIALAWIAPFRDRSPHPPSLPPYFQTLGWIGAIVAQLELRPAMPFTAFLYRIGPMLLMGLVAIALGWGLMHRHTRVSPTAGAMMAMSVICFLLFCAVPLEVNGSWNFPERFPILWILFLIASAAASSKSRRVGVVVGAMAVLVTAGVLVEQWLSISNLAREVIVLNRAVPANAGSVGLIVGPANSAPPGLAFDPYTWAAAAYFRRSNAMLANAPWMNTTTIVLRPVRPDRFSYHGSDESSQELEEMVLGGEPPPDLDFVVQNPPFDHRMELLLKRMGFTCVSSAGEFFRIFGRAPCRPG